MAPIMITRTENGYALGNWEGIPTLLESGRKLTPGEVRAAICRANGLNAADAGRELNCSKNTIYQYWTSIYFKTGCDDVVVAINKMIEVGALHRLQVVLLALMLGTGSLMSASNDADLDIEARTGRSRSTRITRRSSGKRGRAGHFADASSLMLIHLDYWTNGNAGDIYTHADAQGGLS